MTTPVRGRSTRPCVSAGCEQGIEINMKGDCDLQQRVQGHVRFAELDLADQRLPHAGAIGEVALAQPEGKTKLSDPAGQALPEQGLGLKEGLR